MSGADAGSPVGTGASPDADPPTEWGETKNVKWKIKIPGNGASTPVVWGNRVFIQTAVPVGGAPTPAPKLETPPPAPTEGAGQGERPRRRPGGGGGLSVPPPTEKIAFTLLCLDRAHPARQARRIHRPRTA